MTIRYGRRIVSSRARPNPNSHDYGNDDHENLGHHDFSIRKWILLIGLFVIAGFSIYYELDKFERNAAYIETSNQLMLIDNIEQAIQNNLAISSFRKYGADNESLPSYSQSLKGKLVYFYTKYVNAIPVEDEDFFLVTENALAVRRKTQYCQWQESFTETTEREGDQETVSRQYYYIKGWHNLPITSLFFDQPAAHHNPQYDPLPSRTIWTDKAFIQNKLMLDKQLMRRAEPFTAMRALSRDQFQEFKQSAAHKHINVKYIGDGYFYYTSVLSALEKLVRYAAMSYEGTLLDFQLGDLFSQCNAGDIRFSFDKIDLSDGISVIGQIHEDGSRISVYKTNRKFKLGLVHAGEKSAEQMIQDDLGHAHWSTVGIRLLLTLFVAWNIQVFFPQVYLTWFLWSLLSIFTTVTFLSCIWILTYSDKYSYFLLSCCLGTTYFIWNLLSKRNISNKMKEN